MRKRLKNFIQSKAAFWKTRLFFDQKISFYFFKHLYGIQHRYREHKLSAVLLKHSLRGFVLHILYSAAFIFLFELFAKILPYKVPFSPTKDELGLLLSTVATVCGIFLGLYFTAVSASAGSLFMRATEDLQQLFIRERKGSQYIKTLALTTVITLFYLLLQAVDYSISPFGPIVITALATYAIVERSRYAAEKISK